MAGEISAAAATGKSLQLTRYDRQVDFSVISNYIVENVL
jgi:hypothetical protein